MSKIFYLDRFYNLLNELKGKVGGYRQLGDCRGEMDWPERGVYFFFETGEMRSSNPSSPRVVHVGANAVTATKTTSTLWDRLKQHNGGNHRSSIFRLLIGDAIRQHNRKPAPTSQGIGIPATKITREFKRSHEKLVSNYLAEVTFLYVSVPDVPGQQRNPRVELKRNAVALLSGYRERSPDNPSPEWLGRYSTREEVCLSGLWNNKHIGEDYNSDFLDDFEKLIRAM